MNVSWETSADTFMLSRFLTSSSPTFSKLINFTLSTSDDYIVFCRDYSGQLREYRDQCAAMLSEVTQALELLKEMRQKHEFVSHKTGALHQACEQLMEDQVSHATVPV